MIKSYEILWLADQLIRLQKDKVLIFNVLYLLKEYKSWVQV